MNAARLKPVAKAEGTQKRAVTLVSLIFLGLAVFTLLYIIIQDSLGRKDFAANLVEGLAFSFISLAVLVLVGPIVTELFEELIARKGPLTTDAWSSRMRTVISVSLTVIVLVFVLTWFTAPTKLEVQTTSTQTDGGGNTTTNVTTSLHPFVKTLFDVYAVVIAFYFSATAAQSIANTVRDKKGSGGAIPRATAEPRPTDDDVNRLP